MRAMTISWRAVPLVVLAAGATLLAQQRSPEQVTVPFSDPSRPGTVKVELVDGSITVRAENRRDVSISAGGRADGPSASQRPDGLRRLTPAAGFDVTENSNEIVIESSPNRGGAFELRVPVRVNLKLNTVNGGKFDVEGTDGEIEANNVNGSITLTNVSGSAVAGTVNGRLVASMARVAPGKAMAFTSLNGAVDVTLPASTKANLKLQSDMGDVFTDFDLQVSRATSPDSARGPGRGRNGAIRLRINNAITGTVNGGGAEIELRTFNGNVFLRKGK